MRRYRSRKKGEEKRDSSSNGLAPVESPGVRESGDQWVREKSPGRCADRCLANNRYRKHRNGFVSCYADEATNGPKNKDAEIEILFATNRKK